MSTDTVADRARASSQWLHLARSGTGSGNLVFFPPAGASASLAWDLADAVPRPWSIWGVQYPGRGPRLREPQPGSIREIAMACLPDLESGADATVLFGHSFGALVAYDVAQLLQERGRPVAGVLVAGMPAPDGRHASLTADFTDAELIASLTRMGGTTPELMVDEVLELVLPALRSDLGLGRAYVDDHAGPLETGVHGLGGRADRLMTEESLASWRYRTTRWLGQSLGAGDHFFYLQEPALLEDVLTRLWSSC